MVHHGQNKWMRKVEVKSHQLPSSSSRDQRHKRSNTISILLHNIPQEATAKEIWQFFNKGKFILDIVLPRRKDKNNYRIGFAVVSNLALAENLIKFFSGRSFRGNRIVLKLAIKKTQTAQPSYANS